jgi:hypothetical protein
MKHKYLELLRKYDLPTLDQWLILDDELTIADVRRAFQEKLLGFGDILNSMLRPEDMPAMQEAQVLSEKDYESIEKLFNHIMLLAKDCVLADIEASETQEHELVKRLCADWPQLVTNMKYYVGKTKEAYSGSAQTGHTVSYLG